MSLEEVGVLGMEVVVLEEVKTLEVVEELPQRK